MDGLARSRSELSALAATTARPRVLVAPIPITPTKPLTPSHVKFLLWVDVLYRATSRITTVDFLYGHTTGNACQQTLGFWEYLDRTDGDTDYAGWSEEDVGNHYIAYQAEPVKACGKALAPYRDAYENQGWVHPASARLLDAWSEHYATLGVYDPGLRRPIRAPMDIEQLVDVLSAHDLCLDMRSESDGIYVDLTAFGLPLRKLVTADGLMNHLACTLRDIVPLVRRYDQIVLLHDREMTADYLLLQRVIGQLGGQATRIAVDRVAIDGVVRSGRMGGWSGYTVPEIASACSANEYPDRFRLGLRLFLLATIGIGQGLSFDFRLLRRRIRDAERLLGHADPEEHDTEMHEFLLRLTGHKAYVDPYRLAGALLIRGRHVPIDDIVKAIFT